MRPPIESQKMASAALERLPAVDRSRASLPARIAGGADLTNGEVEQCRAVLELPDTSNEALLAAALMGGPRMLAAIAAATEEEARGKPPPGPHEGSMVAMVPTDVEAATLDVPDGFPPEELHITLAFLGPADELPELARVEVSESIEAVLAGWPDPIPVTLGHIGHLGSEDDVVAVALEVTSPALHEFRALLVEELTARSVEWSDQWAFRPHMTISYLTREEADEQWPVGPVPDPVTLDMTKVIARFGPEHEEIDTIGPSAAPESSVTAAAAAPGLPALNDTMNVLNASLQSLDREVGTEVRTAVDLGWRSALDRVGRMATRQATGQEQVTMRDVPAALVAAGPAWDRESLNVEALIRPAVEDTALHVARVTARASNQTVAMIADAFGVELTDVEVDQTVVQAELEERLMAELLFRLGVLSDVDRIDPATDAQPLVAPYQIARDTLAVAGGAAVTDGNPVRDPIGRPLVNGTVGSDSVSLGPGPVQAIRDSILAWGPNVTAAARRSPGIRIPPELGADLGEAAARMAGASDQPPLEQVTVTTWRLNYNGRAIENLPRHEVLAGTTVTSAAELEAMPEAQTDPSEWPGVSYSHPGDHRYCHCGWETRVELQPIQLAIPV